MKALNVDDFIFDLDRVKAVVNSDSKTVSIIEKLQYMINEYEKQHSIEVEPVRHGRWIHCWTFMPLPKGVIWANCSLCDADYQGPEDKANYCPNCGAKMDAEEPTNE